MLIGKRVLQLCILLITTVTQPVSAVENLLPSFTANYRVDWGSMTVGEHSFRLRHETDETIRFESRARTTGFAALLKDYDVNEWGRYRLIQDIIVPIIYHYERNGGDKSREVKIDFDWQEGRATNTVGQEPWSMKIPPGTQDKLSMYLSIMHDLQRGKRDVTYPIADGGKLKNYRFQVVAEEELQTPIGTLATVKLERVRRKKKRETFIWFARDYNYVMVRMEQYKNKELELRLAIQNLEGIQAASMAR